MHLKGQTLHISGIDEPAAAVPAGRMDEKNFYLESLTVFEKLDPSAFNLLIAHRPEFIEDYARLGFDLVVSGRAADGEWTALDYVTSAIVEIPGASNPAFKQAVATVTVPENIAEVKVALVNTGAAWTFAIDYVDITWGAASATPDEPETPDTPDTPDVPTDSKYKEGVAYKLGLDQTAKGETYYFTGVMSGFYGATDTDVSKAVDMFVEIVDGGYKLSFNGESGKQYIKLTQSGTHYNFTFGADASVFTLDTEKDAFYAVAGDQVCYMGTYGNYVTIGTLTQAKLKETDYIARLYTIGGEVTDQHANHR